MQILVRLQSNTLFRIIYMDS